MKPPVLAAPAPLTMAPSNESKALGLGGFRGELGNPLVVAAQIPGADGMLQQGFGGLVGTGGP